MVNSGKAHGSRMRVEDDEFGSWLLIMLYVPIQCQCQSGLVVTDRLLPPEAKDL